MIWLLGLGIIWLVFALTRQRLATDSAYDPPAALGLVAIAAAGWTGLVVSSSGVVGLMGGLGAAAVVGVYWRWRRRSTSRLPAKPLAG